MGDFVQTVEWTDALVLRMRALWDEGLSTQAIGDRLGISKNAVVGKAHRLNFPSRSSPIKGAGGLDVYAQDEAFVKSFTDAWNSDAAREAVAVRFDMSRDRAYAIAKKLGLDMSRRQPAPAPAVTLPPLASVGVAEPIAIERVVRPALTPAAARVAPPRARRVGGKVQPCQFPIGEPGTVDFRFCDEPSEPGGPYCVEHHRRCYVPIRDIEARRAELA